MRQASQRRIRLMAFLPPNSIPLQTVFLAHRHPPLIDSSQITAQNHLCPAWAPVIPQILPSFLPYLMLPPPPPRFHPSRTLPNHQPTTRPTPTRPRPPLAGLSHLPPASSHHPANAASSHATSCSSRKTSTTRRRARRRRRSPASESARRAPRHPCACHRSCAQPTTFSRPRHPRRTTPPTRCAELRPRRRVRRQLLPRISARSRRWWGRLLRRKHRRRRALGLQCR